MQENTIDKTDEKNHECQLKNNNKLKCVDCFIHNKDKNIKKT